MSSVVTLNLSSSKPLAEMAVWWWRSALALLLVSFLVGLDKWVSCPSCTLVMAGRNPGTEKEAEGDGGDELRVMIVANLLLLGSDSGFLDVYFRNYYMARFLRESFQTVKPDMLLVLGDVSARGSELTKSKWAYLLDQYERILGPFLGLPFHTLLGDRDIGECGGLSAPLVGWIASNLPGLDKAGCAAFEISNMTFVSLNSVALLCHSNDLRHSVEKVVERESLEIQAGSGGAAHIVKELVEDGDTASVFSPRKTLMSPGSGPVLLLHFPLYRTTTENCGLHKLYHNIHGGSLKGSNKFYTRRFVDRGPYELLHTIPPNSTEYIFQALRPRIIFSAHSLEFCYYIHEDGTREVSVPAMSWNARDNPGFVLATFRKDRETSISYCSLARESHVVFIYISLLFLLISVMLGAKLPPQRSLTQ